MTWRWKTKTATLMLSTLLLSAVSFGGAAAAPTKPPESFNWTPISSFVPLGTLAANSLGTPANKSGDDEEQRVIVTFKDKKNVDGSLIKGKVKRQQKHSRTISAKMTKKEIDNLKKNADIQSVEPDIQVQSAAQTADWGVGSVHAQDAWTNGFTGQGVKIAVFDSGIASNHEDLTVAGGVSFVDYTTSYDDDSGHGTHVAGIIGAKNNDIGVVGVAPDSSLYAVKVLDASGKGYLSDVLAGIDWAIDNHMDIVNLSFATGTDSPALHNAIDKAYEAGLLIVAAAGNTGNAQGSGNTLQYPAKYSSVISVGAIDSSNQRAPFSATGSELEVTAPGVAITSTYLNNSYAALSGTSMAAPFVSGELALLKQKHSGNSNIQLRNELKNTVLDLGVTGKDGLYGYGLALASSAQPSSTLTDVLAQETVQENVYTGEDTLTSEEGTVYSAAGSPSIQYLSNRGATVYDATTWFPDLTNAKSIAFDGGAFGYTMVLYSDNTVKYKYNRGTTTDATSWFPDLTNSKAITMDGGAFGYTMVLYNDNTVKYKYNRGATADATSWFPDLTNAKAIALDGGAFGYTMVLYNDNTVKYKYNRGTTADATTWFPDLTNARAIALDGGAFGYTMIANIDQSPTLSPSQAGQTAFKSGSPSTFSLSGTVTDADNDAVTVSATISGVTKSTSVSNTAAGAAWSLQWNVNSDNIPVGTYSNISITASDGLWGASSAAYTGNIVVDNVPNVPSSPNPGTTTSGTAPLIAGVTPNLKWTFTDPDAGDTQSAYDVLIYNAAGTTQLYDSGWTSSSLASFNVPSGVLNRGTVYGWKVAVKDNKGGVSVYSPLYYIRTNSLPSVSLTSYTDGQQLSNNILTFTWSYSDADSQAQTSFRVLGSKDGWATNGYDSGVVSGAAVSHMTTAIANGTWSFKVMVYDGMEWNTSAVRTGLVVPNGFEPNDTSAQAFSLGYNTQLVSTVNSATDIDFYKYTAPATGVDRVALTVPGDKNFDVYIYDENLNFVAAGLAATAVAENSIYPVTGGKTYYVKIVGANGDFSAAPYTLQVSKFTLNYNTNYQYDSNGNIISKTTTSN